MLFVKEVMTTELVTTTPDTPLVEAARLMAHRKLGCLPVLEEGRLVGILTEGDFVLLAAKG
jgi:CBS domain-containing protein